jgi:glycosyltransferase 2 family protein
MDQDATPATPSHIRRLLIGCAKLVVSVGLLALLFSRTDINSIWTHVRDASGVWLVAGLLLYATSMAIATWRWGLLCEAQGITVRTPTLFASYLVASFFNNFLPSNIGGDVIRIRDTAGPAGSKTLATTVVLFDRAIGLMGVVLTAAIGASVAAGASSTAAALPVVPSWLWAGFLLATVVGAPAVIAPEGVGRLLQPLTIFHPEWVGDRIEKITGTLERFRERPTALLGGFAGAMAVQAVMVLFYAAVARSFNIPITTWHLAVVVPVSFVVQMLPVSVNGFGVREATFSFYFARIGLPIGSAIALSLGAQALIMLFSLTGAACYVMRRHPHKKA